MCEEIKKSYGNALASDEPIHPVDSFVCHIFNKAYDALLGKNAETTDEIIQLIDGLNKEESLEGRVVFVAPHNPEKLEENGITWEQSVALALFESAYLYRSALRDPEYTKEEIAILGTSLALNNEVFSLLGTIPVDQTKEVTLDVAKSVISEYEKETAPILARGVKDILNKKKAATARWDGYRGMSAEKAYSLAVKYIEDLIVYNKVREGEQHNNFVDQALEVEWIKGMKLSRQRFIEETKKMLKKKGRTDLIRGWHGK